MLFISWEKTKVWAGPGPPGQSLASPWPGAPQVLPTPGGRDSGRLGLSVRTWLAEAATAADLKGVSGGAKPPQEKKFKLVFSCLNLGELLGRAVLCQILACVHVSVRRPWSAPIGVRGAAEVRRGPFSLKSRIFGRFGPQEWSGWVRTADSVHLVFVSGQIVDSRPISDQI